MDPNYANPGGGSVGSATAAGIGASAADRYNPLYYKDQVSCQRSISYNAYDPYGGSSTGVRTSSVYPYDAEAEFKERTGMGKAKTSHQQLAGSVASNSAKQYNFNSCYGNYNQTNTAALAPENYYAYAYDQHHHYSQQQQYHQQQYKYKVVGQQQQQLLHQQQQQQQQQSALNAAMKMSPPEYGYAPYHHPYYHPHYHHPQKGGVNVKSLPDGSAMPYVNSKVLHSPAMGGGRGPQYPSNYSYHSYPGSAAAAGHHHTYQSQSVCDDSRWLWNTNSTSNTTNGSEYPNNYRGTFPLAKQNTIWPPSVPMQYQNTMSSGYPATAANQSCCLPTQSASTYYPSQQYAKYSVSFSGSNNDLYNNSQVNASLPAVTTNATSKVYTDLNAPPPANVYQTASSAVSYHQPGDCSVSSALDFNSRYLQPQQTDSPSGSSASSTSSYSHHYYHPYAHQTYSGPGPQEPMYAQQQVDTKIGPTTKSQSLRDFLTSWNEDEDECADRAMSSADVPFIDQLHLTAEHFSQSQDNPIMENHLQFKGSFSSRPKIHVGITVDSTVESDQYINLPDIIIDIEKSSKEVVSLPESIPMETIPKEEIIIKEEKPEGKPIAIPPPPPRKKRKCSHLSKLQRMRQTKRNQRKWKKAPRKQLMIRRVKIRPTSSPTKPPLHFNPQSLKCLCVSLINSEKFQNRILGPSEIVDSLITHLTTADDEVSIDVAAASTDTSSSVIPKLSDLCKNALNSSFDRDVLVINLDEILDSDNLFVVQCDINENILENYVDVDQLEQQPEEPQQSAANNVDLVEILNDNNNNNNSTSSRNYIPTTTTVTPKRCCSVTEVSNLPLDNSVEHNNLNLPTNPGVHTSLPPAAPSSPSSSSCPAVLCFRSSSSPPPLIEQNCPTKQNTTAGGGHEQLHELLMLSAAGIAHGDISQDHHHHHRHNNLSNDSNLLMLDTNSTPSIHHEEIVPDNLKKFQNEKFLKYLHAKYVQGNLSEFYHANRIIKKYKKRIIKKLLNIVVR